MRSTHAVPKAIRRSVGPRVPVQRAWQALGGLARTALVGLAVGIGLGLAGPAVAQVPRDTLVIAMEAEPPGLDPGQALGLHTLRVTYQIFETLVTTPEDRKS